MAPPGGGIQNSPLTPCLQPLLPSEIPGSTTDTCEYIRGGIMYHGVVSYKRTAELYLWVDNFACHYILILMSGKFIPSIYGTCINYTVMKYMIGSEFQR